MPSLVEIVGGAAIAAAGLARLLVSLRKLRSAADSRRWRRYDAEIIGSRVVPYRVRMSGEGWGNRIYRPVIQYRYTVDGHEYTSDRIYHGRPLGRPWRGSLDKLVRRYPVGTRTNVYVPPEQPHLGLLEPGARFDAYAEITVFAVMLAVGIALVLGLLS